MSYLVLARKWRPQYFSDLLGQEHVCQTLTNAIKHDRMAHAFLFCGPRGVGKTSAARILAKTLICPRGKSGKPCNNCAICGEISNGASIDVIEIDGASNNGVDSIRELREKACYLPAQGIYKVYIIDEVHMLSQSAFNALLKILEEPPPHLKFIFATTESYKIPVTIISRCQRFDFKKIPLKMLEGHLEKIASEEKITIEKDALLKIAKEARGSFRDALSLLDQAISFAQNKITLKHLHEILGSVDEEVLFNILEKTFKKEAIPLLKHLADIYGQGHDVKQLFSELLDLLRSLLLLKLALQENKDAALDQIFDLTDHEISRLKEFASLISLEELDLAYQFMFKGIQDMAYTRHPQFVLETTLIKILQLKPLIPIEILLERVEALQKSFKHHTPTALLGQPPVVPLSPTKTAAIQGTNLASNDLWNKLVEHIKVKRPALAAILEHGYFIACDQNKVTIGFSQNSVFHKLISEKDNVSSFQRIVSEYLNMPMSLHIAELNSDHLKKTYKNIVQENEKEIDGIKKEALEHEWVQTTQKIFDADIIDVKVSKIEKGVDS